MVVEIDDSGWGDLVGGAVVVMRRVETDETHIGEIPLELFQISEFKYKVYLRRAQEIIIEGLDKLQVQMDEPIHICTGYILSTARETLRKLGYRIIDTKIKGTTQELAENEFLRHLEKIGIGTIIEVASIRSFNGFMNWLKEDIEIREKYVKTGWKSWQTLRREM